MKFAQLLLAPSLSRTAVVTFLLTVVASFLNLSASSASIATLNADQRNELRMRLENLYNEVDLMVLNRKSDESDLKRQEREFQALKVFERIPFNDNLGELERELKQTAGGFQVSVDEVKLVGRSEDPPAVPQTLISDQKNFHLTDEQLTQKLNLNLQVTGSHAAIQNWIKSWKEGNLRIIQPGRLYQVDQPGVDPDRWNFLITTYRFRDLNYPKLQPRNPMELLPKWAQRNSKAFARKEPQLWRFIERFYQRKPTALPLYPTREKILLNDARMSFFLKLAQ